MKKTVKRNIALGIAALSLVIAGGSLASLTSSRIITNHAQYDTVDISLSERSVHDEDGDGFVMPNETVSIIPEIRNRGVVSYIRLNETVKVIRKDGKVETFSPDQVSGEGKDWQKGKDGRFYYLKKFSEDGLQSISTHFTIPPSWGDEYMDGKVKVIVTAEAVQKRNFSDEGISVIGKWNGLKVERTVRTRTYNLEVKKK